MTTAATQASAVPVWAWPALAVVIAALLAVDLLLHRDNHVVSLREAAIWSAIWITAGLAFGVLLWWWQGGSAGTAYFASYLIEKTLSIDNVFVFALIFTYFAVPASFQHKVLFWGVVGALGFRLVFIFAGAQLLQTFFWTAYIFGAFLIYTGYQMAFKHDQKIQPERNPVVRLVRRILPTDARYHGSRFFTRQNGRRQATLLFVVLVAIEASDLIFAVDSIAAILAITTDTFVLWSANAFAILGLRALYFCLAGLLRRFSRLHYGLAVLLAFAGREAHPGRDRGRQVAHRADPRRDRGDHRRLDRLEPAVQPARPPAGSARSTRTSAAEPNKPDR